MAQYLLLAYETEGFGKLTEVLLNNGCIYSFPP